MQPMDAVCDQGKRSDHHVPGIPPLKATDVDTESTEQADAKHEQPAAKPSSSTGYNALHPVQRNEREHDSDEGEEQDDDKICPPTAVKDGFQMLEVGEDVRSVGKEEQPRHGGCAEIPGFGPALFLQLVRSHGQEDRNPSEDYIPHQEQMREPLRKKNARDQQARSENRCGEESQ